LIYNSEAFDGISCHCFRHTLFEDQWQGVRHFPFSRVWMDWPPSTPSFICRCVQVVCAPVPSALVWQSHEWVLLVIDVSAFWYYYKKAQDTKLCKVKSAALPWMSSCKPVSHKAA
jgi:hypothetical protein